MYFQPLASGDMVNLGYSKESPQCRGAVVLVGHFVDHGMLCPTGNSEMGRRAVIRTSRSDFPVFFIKNKGYKCTIR